MKKVLCILMLLCMVCTGAWADYTWQGGETFDATGWNTESNWNATFTSAGKGPGTQGSNMWEVINLSNVTGTTPTMEGWNLRMILDAASITVPDINKFQNGTGVTATYTLKNASTLNLPYCRNQAMNFIVNFNGAGNTMNFDVKANYGGTATVNFGSIANDNSNVINVTTSSGAARTATGLVIAATLPDANSSATTEFHKVKVATVGANVTVTNLSYNISGTGFSRSDVELTDSNKEENVGKYYCAKDADGNVWLSWVTGSIEQHDVTFHIKNAYGETFDVVVSNVLSGTFAVAPELEYFSDPIFEEANCKVSASNKEFHVTGTWSFPFQEGKFYQIKNCNQQYLKNVDASNITTKNPANNNAADMLWYFKHVANTQNQYTIHSVSTETAWNGTSGKMTLAAEGTPFQILKKDANFNIFSGNPNGYVGAHSNYNGANGAVGYWSDGTASEPGSQWTVLEFDESVLDALNLTNGAEGYVGSFKGDISDAQTAANTYKTNKTAANLKTALSVERITIDPNKFYQLISQDSNSNNGRVVFSPAYCSTTGTNSNYGDRNIKLGTAGGAATTCTSALKFIPNGDGYTIQHVNSNYYFVKLSAFNNLGNPDLPINTNSAGKYLLHNVTGQPSDIWVLNNDNATNKYLHCGYEGDNVNTLVIVTDSPAGNNGLRWKIKEITEVPVTIGSVGYTTVCFPMAVEIPNDVTAYKVTEETDDKMMLEAVTGAVAAKTPLIIEKNGGGAAVFPVVTSGETLSDNRLSGSTARRVGFAASSFYALAADNNASNGVSFKINGSVNAVPANKAYLVPSSGAGTQALYFSFDEGLTTGVESTTLLPNADVLYNLQGQPVSQPTRGIYVKANGQKVFILK